MHILYFEIYVISIYRYIDIDIYTMCEYKVYKNLPRF